MNNDELATQIAMEHEPVVRISWCCDDHDDEHILECSNKDCGWSADLGTPWRDHIFAAINDAIGFVDPDEL